LWNHSGSQNGPFNIYSYYIGYNPPTSVNPYPKFLRIHNKAFLSPFTFVVGDVTIGGHTYVGPFVSIRADEGTASYKLCLFMFEGHIQVVTGLFLCSKHKHKHFLSEI
jgi:carbonic anhydrase